MRLFLFYDKCDNSVVFLSTFFHFQKYLPIIYMFTYVWCQNILQQRFFLIKRDNGECISWVYRLHIWVEWNGESMTFLGVWHLVVCRSESLCRIVLTCKAPNAWSKCFLLFLSVLLPILLLSSISFKSSCHVMSSWVGYPVESRFKVVIQVKVRQIIHIDVCNKSHEKWAPIMKLKKRITKLSS